MTELQIKCFELPPLPTLKPGGAPIFRFDSIAEISAAGILAVVRRFAYWDERDGKPLEVGFEAYIDGLPETAGVADVVATHPDVLADLAAVSGKAAELLRTAREAKLP